MDHFSVSERVLIVDDSEFAREFLRRMLRSRYDCVVVDSVQTAMEELERIGVDGFVTVLTDYNMPGRTGLDLLANLRDYDPTLTTVIVTAEGEKDIVTRALRLGVHGYLEKGVGRAQLLDTVQLAADATRKRRELRQNALAAREVGRSQLKLLGLNIERLQNRVRCFYQPCDHASGDFVSILPGPDGRLLILASDVSGHDLKAAFPSIYFQGLARGMILKDASMREVFEAVNRFLLESWNSGDSIEIAIASLGVCLEPETGEVEMLNCGFPRPLLTDLAGRTVSLESITSSPLGWFPELPDAVSTKIDGGHLRFWSDGLEDLADRLGVDPLACAFRLLEREEESDSLLSLARDDIIVVEACLGNPVEGGEAAVIPILAQTYAGDGVGRIDGIQTLVESSLKLIKIRFSEQILSAVLLCIREAMLNAFEHGCQNRADRHASLRIFLSRDRQCLTVEVEDEGDGHDFDPGIHEGEEGAPLMEGHRGLFMIKYLADETILSSGGRIVTMLFKSDPTR